MFQRQRDDGGVEIPGEHILSELNCVPVGRTYRAAWHKIFVHRSEQATDLLINE
jgi:hypothetical protein